jgi:hypothetical protein
MFLVVLGGSAVFQATHGEIRELDSGGVLLAEDTVGKGHTTWNVSGDTVLIIATIPLTS